nr:unnamed protein product [Callosobruchus chinensis]
MEIFHFKSVQRIEEQAKNFHF